MREREPSLNFEESDFSGEKNDEEVFREYMEDLDLSPEDFNKKILDIGSGSAQFAKWAKDHSVNSSIFSLEPTQEMEEGTKGARGRAEAIPFEDESFELVVSNSSIPNIYLGGNSEELEDKIEKSFSEIIRVTKEGGEVRLGNVLKGEIYDSQKELSFFLNKKLEELKEIPEIEIEEIRHPWKDTYEYKDNKPVKLLAKAFLIKIRKK